MTKLRIFINTSFGRVYTSAVNSPVKKALSLLIGKIGKIGPTLARKIKDRTQRSDRRWHNRSVHRQNALWFREVSVAGGIHETATATPLRC
jgi:hypothetical protein